MSAAETPSRSWSRSTARASRQEARARPPSLLETGALPVEDLAALARREGLRPRPIYQAHRWFARRFGSVFRALLTASALPAGGDFWQAYYEGVDLAGVSVLDPFVGGGTSVVEALRLGADVTGVDVDAVACAITRFELRAAEVPDLGAPLDRLKRAVGGQMAPYYRTAAGESATEEMLHAFWVQVVACAGCGQTVEAHPHHQLAYDAEGTKQWAFCASCHAVQELDRNEVTLRCSDCGVEAAIVAGAVRYGRLTCTHCGARERLIDVAARTARPPEWRLFALEVLDPDGPRTGRALPMAHRRFRRASDADRAAVDAAAAALAERTGSDGRIAFVPERAIPREQRADDRLPRYGYRRYRELFNPRQLLHLSLLGEATASIEGPEREALVLAFSDHLATNCMMASYAFGWRRAVPLFAVRAFRHITRPVEVNPWLDGTGRGTFPNAVRQVQRAGAFARAPQEPSREGGFCPAPASRHDDKRPAAAVLHQNAQDLSGIETAAVDLVLTDPPYFDNIAYSELSDFYLPWLQLFGLAPADRNASTALAENLAAKGRDAAALEAFRVALGQCMIEIARVLKPEGRLVFTYQHRTPGAWGALARALAGAGIRPVQLFPLLGDGRGGLHTRDGTSTWDAVFVAVRGAPPRGEPLLVPAGELQAALRHSAAWTDRLRRLGSDSYREADERNFARACVAAAALGLFGGDQQPSTGQPLIDVLEQVSGCTTTRGEPR